MNRFSIVFILFPNCLDGELGTSTGQGLPKGIGGKNRVDFGYWIED